MGVGMYDGFVVYFQDQVQYIVCGWMLWVEVYCVVVDFLLVFGGIVCKGLVGLVEFIYFIVFVCVFLLVVVWKWVLLWIMCGMLICGFIEVIGLQIMCFFFLLQCILMLLISGKFLWNGWLMKL